MKLEDYDLTEQQRQRVEQIEDDLADLDRREEQLLQELASVLDAAPEVTAR